jgi:hypothetical protein
MPQNPSNTWMCALEIEVNQLYKLILKSHKSYCHNIGRVLSRGTIEN